MNLKLKTCCCCFRLSTGGIILGILSLILPLISFGLLVYLNGFMKIVFVYTFTNQTTGEPSYVGIPVNNIQYYHHFITYLGITMIIGGLLLWGSLKRNRFLIVPWLLQEVLMLILLKVFFVIEICMYMQGSKVTGVKPLITLLVMLPIIGYFWYIVACVYSFYCTLRDEDEKSNIMPISQCNEIITDHYNLPPNYTKM